MFSPTAMPIDLSAYADPVIDELVSGEPKIDGTLFFDILSQAQSPILELGCGYGRLTIPLAQRGIKDLTGLELSAPSIAAARRKASDLPIQWVEGDARDFHLERQFGFIFARGGVFDFLLTRPEQESMLACVREHLAEGGQFMFDVCELPPYRMFNQFEVVEWFTMTHPKGRKIHFSGKDWYDHSKQHYIQVCYERWDGPEGELLHEPWELTLKYNMPQEIETLLHYNSFKVVDRYADYDGNRGTADVPPTIYICETA